VADITITQVEADALIAMPKVRADADTRKYPALGGALTIPLTSADKRENFLLDISRGRIDLLRGKYQNRARHVIVLVRLDFGGPPHHNPDGTEVPCPHLHVYREGYGDKYAMPIPKAQFPDTGDLWEMLEDFMRYCNVTDPPFIEKGLFV
jgi:hypothetical protein